MQQMNALATNTPLCLEAQGQKPRISSVEGWTLREYDVLSSTNLLAARLSAWEAVYARTQTAGRGRFQRNWVSDEGGLWLSAVLPTGTEPQWRTLPLAVGLAVCDALRAMGVQQLRMRWPNDVLVNDRKLAGLLIDQFTPGLAVAGIGINVSNQPETRDAALSKQTARLADLLPAAPALSEVAAAVLRSLRRVAEEMRAGGLGSLHSRINLLWGPPRRVELDLDGVIRRGLFTGVDQDGRLILSDDAGGLFPYHSHQVRHLKEL